MYYNTLPCDRLPKKSVKNRTRAYIVNTDPAGEPGQHWIALWTKDQVCEVMDSYGLPLKWYPKTQPMIDWITKHWKHWISNGTSLQGLHSQACGHYALTYLKCKARGGTLQDFLRSFSESDFVSNDKLVGEMLESKSDVWYKEGYQSCHTSENVIKSCEC